MGRRVRVGAVVYGDEEEGVIKMPSFLYFFSLSLSFPLNYSKLSCGKSVNRSFFRFSSR